MTLELAIVHYEVTTQQDPPWKEIFVIDRGQFSISKCLVSRDISKRFITLPCNTVQITSTSVALQDLLLSVFLTPRTAAGRQHTRRILPFPHLFSSRGRSFAQYLGFGNARSQVTTPSSSIMSSNDSRSSSL